MHSTKNRVSYVIANWEDKEGRWRPANSTTKFIEDSVLINTYEIRWNYGGWRNGVNPISEMFIYAADEYDTVFFWGRDLLDKEFITDE
jgi:hypothetical protein